MKADYFVFVHLTLKNFHKQTEFDKFKGSVDLIGKAPASNTGTGNTIGGSSPSTTAKIEYGGEPNIG